MKNIQKNIFAKILSLIVMAMLVLPFNALPVSAEDDVQATAKIKHKQVKYFVPGFRIKLETNVTDKEGVNLVRCYFKSQELADYVFVPMHTTANDRYEGILPAPNKNTESIDYLFLAVNNLNNVVKTQTFTMKKKDDEAPAWQQVSSEGEIKVSTELAKAPELTGFTDSIAMDVVESSARFGAVAGIYSKSQIAASGGTSDPAAKAKYAGIVIAVAGMSNLALMAGGLALVGGGVAVAAKGGGGSSGSGGGGGGGTQLFTASTPNGAGSQVAPLAIEIIPFNAVSAPMTVEYNGSNIGTYSGTGIQEFPLPGVGGVITLTLTSDVSGASLQFHFKTSGGKWPSPFSGQPVTGITGDYITLQTQ